MSRIPFDLPEAEGELVAGYHTEYGGMRFAMFQNAEYVALIAFSAVASILFFGGYEGPWLPGPLWMLIKMTFFILIAMWVRATLPAHPLRQAHVHRLEGAAPGRHPQPARHVGDRGMEGVMGRAD